MLPSCYFTGTRHICFMKSGWCDPVLSTHDWSQASRNVSESQIQGYLEGLDKKNRVQNFLNSLAFLLGSSLFCNLRAVYIGPYSPRETKLSFLRDRLGPLLTQSWSDSTHEPEQVPQIMCVLCRLHIPRDTCWFLTWLQHKAWHFGDLQSSLFPEDNPSTVLKLYEMLCSLEILNLTTSASKRSELILAYLKHPYRVLREAHTAA